MKIVKLKWKISNWHLKKLNLNLELILRCGDSKIKRVNIEMNLDESFEFVDRLKLIEKELLTASSV